VRPNQTGRPVHEHGASFVHEENSSRGSLLGKLFSGYTAAKAQTRAQAAATHSAEWGDYESRAALMQKNAANAPKTSSLTDTVRSLFGRR
jgi:hypothetical protein